jgi:uncharacterized tellurite resistance protein B-like protein
MGLFSMFKSDKGDQMTPHLAFAISLLYCMSADGEMDNEEVGHLLSVLGGESQGGTIGVGANNRALLDSAMRYVRSNRPDKFLAEATPLLTDAQRMCILMNMVDSALSDGQPEPEEQALIGQFQSAFGITDDRFKPFFDVIVLKHDRSIFLNQSHPMNAPGFQVSINGIGR